MKHCKGSDECGKINSEAKAVVYGKWEECDWVQDDGHFGCEYRPKAGVRCSNCGYAFKKELLWIANLCPNCGADMRKKVNDD